MVMWFVPKPHVSYLLDADPVQARARKPEYPLEFLYFCRASYMTLSGLIGGMTIIPPMPVHEVERKVLQYALNSLPVGSIQGELAEDLVAEKDRD
jgi:hypothetical protein